MDEPEQPAQPDSGPPGTSDGWSGGPDLSVITGPQRPRPLSPRTESEQLELDNVGSAAKRAILKNQEHIRYLEDHLERVRTECKDARTTSSHWRGKHANLRPRFHALHRDYQVVREQAQASQKRDKREDVITTVGMGVASIVIGIAAAEVGDGGTFLRLPAWFWLGAGIALFLCAGGWQLYSVKTRDPLGPALDVGKAAPDDDPVPSLP